MRHVRCLCETKSTLTRVQYFTIHHALRRANRELLNAYECAHHATYSLFIGADFQPFVKLATLVSLKMTEADPAYLSRIDDGLQRLTHRREQHPHAGMKQQRLFVPD